MKPVICPHCDTKAKLVKGTKIYPHRADLHNKNYWLCECGAYVGCHPDSKQALGTPANIQLRQMRSYCHRIFDPLWRNTDMSRADAYKSLAAGLCLERHKCHIGMFTEEQCDKMITYIEGQML